MSLITIDKKKCTRCRICVEVCPTSAIKMGNEFPQETKQDCIACGHCVAACPYAAIDNNKAPLSNQTQLKNVPVLDASTAEYFLRSRRSIRVYKQNFVSHEKIQQILNIARMAPSGGNTQGVVYHIFDNPDTLKKIVSTTVEWMGVQIGAGSPWGPYYKNLIDHYHKTGHDFILRGAPCLIVALADKTSLTRGRDNTHFSLSYAELYAPTIGLGTCWAGFFEACAASNYPPMVKLLDLPKEMSVTGGLMVGYPKFTYNRLVDRNPLQVTWH